MNKETKIMAVFFVVLALGIGNLRAEIVEINITAEISEIHDQYGLLNGQLSVGSIISGSYIYDSDTPDSSLEPDYGEYLHTSGPHGITLNAGGFVFQTDPDNVEFLVGIENGLIGISALLTTMMPAMEKTINALKEAGISVKVIIGGAPVTQGYADKIGADGYAADAASAVDVAKTLVA